MSGRRPTVRLMVRPRARPEVYQSMPEAPADWGLIARLYDLEHPSCRGAELAFWHGLASAGQTPTGNVLELAAGSGRVAIALARKGHRVTGLELSPGMLERAKARTAHLPPAVGARLEWVVGDMTEFELPTQDYSLAFVAYNSFWLLNSEAAQVACLRAVARHLAPDGRLVLDLFVPNEDDRQDDVGIVQRLPMARHGQDIFRVKDYTYDAVSHLATSDVRYFAGDPDARRPAALLVRFRYVLRLAEPADVESLLTGEGYVVEETHGTYEREHLAPESPRAIFVARRR